VRVLAVWYSPQISLRADAQYLYLFFTHYGIVLKYHDRDTGSAYKFVQNVATSISGKSKGVPSLAVRRSVTCKIISGIIVSPAGLCPVCTPVYTVLEALIGYDPFGPGDIMPICRLFLAQISFYNIEMTTYFK
jgi:hypothetical protein